MQQDLRAACARALLVMHPSVHCMRLSHGPSLACHASQSLMHLGALHALESWNEPCISVEGRTQKLEGRVQKVEGSRYQVEDLR